MMRAATTLRHSGTQPGCTKRLAPRNTAQPSNACSARRGEGDAAITATPMFGLAAASQPRPGSSIAAVISGAHCPSLTDMKYAPPANIGSRYQPSRVTAYASSAPDTNTNRSLAHASGSAASGEATINAVTG